MVLPRTHVLVVDADPLWRTMLERVIARTDGLALAGSVASTGAGLAQVTAGPPDVALVGAAHVPRLVPRLVAAGSRVVVLYDGADALADTHARRLEASGCVVRDAPAAEIATVLLDVASGTTAFRCA